MAIVSNTTPIISLLKINKQNLLKDIFGKIVIPKSVYNEIIAKKEFENEISLFNSCEFIKVQKTQNEFAVKILQKQLGLDLGESEAIVLAEELKSKYLLIDERKGRKVAKESGLEISGTVSILIKAKNLGLIDLVKPLLDKLIDKNIRISQNLYKEVLRISGE